MSVLAWLQDTGQIGANAKTIQTVSSLPLGNVRGMKHLVVRDALYLLRGASVTANTFHREIHFS
jgi:hypothetical protein